MVKRSQGRPKYRWEDDIKQDICQMKIKNWIACVQDQGKWKEVVEKAKTRKFSVWKKKKNCFLEITTKCEVGAILTF